MCIEDIVGGEERGEQGVSDEDGDKVWRIMW